MHLNHGSQPLRIRCERCRQVLLLDGASSATSSAATATTSSPRRSWSSGADSNPSTGFPTDFAGIVAGSGRVCPECGHPIDQSVEAVRREGVRMEVAERRRLRLGALLFCGAAAAIPLIYIVHLAWPAAKFGPQGAGREFLVGLCLAGAAAAMWMLVRSWLLLLAMSALTLLTVSWAVTRANSASGAALGAPGRDWLSPVLLHAAACAPALVGLLLWRLTEVDARLGLRPARREAMSLMALGGIGVIGTWVYHPHDVGFEGLVMLLLLGTIAYVVVRFWRMARRLDRVVPLAE